MKQLIEKLKKASYAYYALDSPIMSDKEYDDLYDELSAMEEKTGVILAGSPTQKVQGYVLDGFKKVRHSKPMLSADKTKDIADIKKFIGNADFYCSYKLDGLTIVVRYENGEFVQGITRGNGEIGEDVTEACRFIRNLPMKIPYKEPLELRGECVISWMEFARINETLEQPYSHPRNLAAGTIRNLDLNIVKERELSFVVFECVTDMEMDNKRALHGILETVFGFEVVQSHPGDLYTPEEMVERMPSEGCPYPCDGLIFEFNSNSYSISLGATGHHERCRMALKWADDLYLTKLTDIEWSTSRSGLINPVAVFEEVDLDGALTTRATLHNISYIEDLQLGIGDEIQVYRANMVIPKVHDNLTRSNTWQIPMVCPTCGANVEIHNDNGSKTLHCTNEFCSAKLLFRAANFVSKKAMNIDGLSEATLEKFVDLGWIQNLSDIYHLDNYFPQLKKMSGFGKKSVENLAVAIEKSKDVELVNFITALGIPGIGPGQAKTIVKKFKTWNEFADAINQGFHFDRLAGFGETLDKNIYKWYVSMYQKDNVEELAKMMRFREDVITDAPQILAGKTFVITGKLKEFANRDTLVAKIESLGGKVSGSVSSKVHYLINNDSKSNSSKNKKAAELGVPVVTELEFIEMIKED